MKALLQSERERESQTSTDPHIALSVLPHSSVRTEGQFTYGELESATDRFSGKNFLGEGGFGFVHKGILPNGRLIAVKQFKMDANRLGEREFMAEFDVLSRIHHRNLVEYIGSCISHRQRLLVCEFVPNKTLEFHLHGVRDRIMDWPTRFKISLGTAKGLAYLHEDCRPRIIHRDVKSANILLDDSFEAKVADFGLAKFFPEGATHVYATHIMGTRGYLAPEYANKGELREESDTFSFGVVLLELITGRRPIFSLSTGTTDSVLFETLANWARPLLAEALNDSNYDSLVDPNLQNKFDTEEMKRIVACAAACIRLSAQERPSMSQVVLVLQGRTSIETLDGIQIQIQSSSRTDYADFMSTLSAR